jgi:hypothetical protein
MTSEHAREHLRHVCPRCSSHNIAPIPDDEIAPAGDALLVDAPEPAPEPPNMRCGECGHTWWLAPLAPPVSRKRPGVPE